MSKETIYENKHAGYFQGDRPDVVALIPENASNSILELGCGEGHTLVNARSQGRAGEIIGIDIIPVCPAHARLDRYLQGDVDTLEIPYPNGYFDVIVCADVLEHLVNPWQVVKKLSMLLKPGGCMIVSLPNVRNYSLFVSVYLKGSFAYQQEGLLDRGHLRFFCKRDIRQLFEEAQLSVERFHFNLAKVRKAAWIVSCGLLEEILVKQYLVVAHKN